MNKDMKQIHSFIHPLRSVGLLPGVLLFFAHLSPIRAEVFTPRGYEEGQKLENLGWGMDLSFTKISEDYYISVTPRLETPFFFDMAIAFQIPLDFLVLDREPKSGQKVPSLREGTYDTKEDYFKTIRYIKKGTHLYYDPDDLFNWSFYYGHLTDGYIGHRTIVDRYVSSLDPLVYRPGLMADFNNNWGGFEYFESDISRREVQGGRVYVRPIGIFIALHNLLLTGGFLPENRHVALSLEEKRNPDLNGGVFFQEESTVGGGSLRQQFLKKMKDAIKGDRNGSTGSEAAPNGSDRNATSDRPDKKDDWRSSTERGGRARGRGGDTIGDTEDAAAGEERQTRASRSDKGRGDDGENGGKRKRQRWEPSYFGRWSIGYTLVKDRHAPLTLEKDGSGNLVVDPVIHLPRGDKTEEVAVVGYDTEFRVSPFRWLEFTPYMDVNHFKNLPKSEGTHIGIDFSFKLFSILKFSFRPEYREFSQNYIPSYFDSYYTRERTGYTPPGVVNVSGTSASTGQTKLGYAKSLGQGGSKKKGGMATLTFDFVNLFVLEGEFQDYDGPQNSQVFLGVYLPPSIFGIFLNGYYTKKGFESYKEAFIYDDRSLIAGEVGMDLFLGFSVKLSYLRTWIYDTATSAYVANDEKTISFGYTGTL